MSDQKPERRVSRGAFERKAFSISATELVKTAAMEPGRSLPLLAQPAVKGVDLIGWVANNRGLIEAQLFEHGAILFRGFDICTVSGFEQFIRTISGELLEYKERSSPRSAVSGRIYTSTDYPADQPIFLHNENSYQHIWPMKIFFFCVTPARQGGETPIADCRKVLHHIAPEIKERFERKKWMCVRNFGDGFGIPWQTVFQTTDKNVVEAYCHRADIECEWKIDNRLRTRQIRPAISVHPRTGEMVWFNHLAFFHVSTLPSSVREALLLEFAEEDLPTNTYYGDGTLIEPEVLDEIRSAYAQETTSFPWQEGDLLMLDNMLTAHSRTPFTGSRKVVVGMSEPAALNN